ncbi:MAG: hypothetical protein K2G88_01135, partial [Oscillospiraceae bacterium]|nr:hypothetical protein [Oscillospiraceae bacterium]
IYDGAGKHTLEVIEDKIFDYDLDVEDAIRMLEDEQIATNFNESICKLICECGYNGLHNNTKEAIREMTAFICNAFASLGEESTISERTVRRWLKGENRPNSSFKSRESMFQLMFALKASLEQTTNFFWKSYYAQPFNFRNKNECIYYWCLKNNKGWDIVKHIKHDLKLRMSENPVSNSFDGETILIGKALNELETPDEVVAYIANNFDDEETYFQTAKNNFKDLLEEAKQLAKDNFGKLNTNATDCKEENIAYRRQKESVDFLLSVIFHPKKTITTSNKWVPLIKENFPTKEQFSRCRKGDDRNADLLRKCIILLKFYISYEQDDAQSDFETFYSEVNYLLEECGFLLLYPTNPYDRIFMTCVYNGEINEQNPLEYFRETFFDD